MYGALLMPREERAGWVRGSVRFMGGGCGGRRFLSDAIYSLSEAF